jgi:hypothetical protein
MVGNDVCRTKTTDTTNNVSALVCYAHALHDIFRPFLGHHQANHENTNLIIELCYFNTDQYFTISVLFSIVDIHL